MQALNGSTPHGWRYAIRRDGTTRTWHVHARHASGVEQRAPFADFEHALAAVHDLLHGHLEWAWLPCRETLPVAARVTGAGRAA